MGSPRFRYRKLIRQTERKISEVCKRWKLNLWRVLPYVQSFDDETASKWNEACSFIWLFSNINFYNAVMLIPCKTWNCPYPDSFVQFFNDLQMKGKDHEYRSPLFPFKVIEDMAVEFRKVLSGFINSLMDTDAEAYNACRSFPCIFVDLLDEIEWQCYFYSMLYERNKPLTKARRVERHAD